MSGIRTYHDLDVWQRAMALATAVYDATSGFPRTEQYGLTAQIRRAAISIPSNIAEGHSRSRSSYVYHLSVARGSVSELETQLELALRLGMLNRSHSEALTELSQQTGQMLNALIRALDR